MNQQFVCRVCATTGATLGLVDIFVEYVTQERIADILLELAGIKATVDDGFPRSCCIQCHSDLTSAICVRRKCIEAEKLFQASLVDCSSPFFDSLPDSVPLKQDQIPSYHCSECSIDFYTEESLQEHYQSNHANAIYGWKSFGISEISLFDTTDDEAEEEIAVTMPKQKPVTLSHRCCGCTLVFDTLAELQQHSQTVHAPNAMELSKEKPVHCEVCYHAYTSRKGVMEHRNAKGVMRHQCSTCGVLYGSTQQLLSHEFKHREHKFACDICGKEFSHLKYVNKHKHVVHVAQELREKFACHICGAYVKSASYLKVHLKLHSDEAPFVCSICGARFKLRKYLTWHMTMHRRFYKCDDCDTSFTTQAELTHHLTTHAKSRNYACSLCPQRYHSKRNLAKHVQNLHKGKKL